MCAPCREIEYLKKETAQRRAEEESEATHKEEADNLQEKVRKILTWFQIEKVPRFPILMSFNLYFYKAPILFFSLILCRFLKDCGMLFY